MSEGICLDIAAMSVEMNQAQVKQQASLSVLKSTMSIAKQHGEALVERLEVNASHPTLGTTIDVKGEGDVWMNIKKTSI